MWVGVERRGDERSVWSDDCAIAGLDRDLCAVVQTAEAHLAFSHFQACVMGTCDETERRAHDDGVGFRCRKDERVSARLLLQRASYVAMLKFDARPFPG